MKYTFWIFRFLFIQVTSFLIILQALSPLILTTLRQEPLPFNR